MVLVHNGGRNHNWLTSSPTCRAYTSTWEEPKLGAINGYLARLR